MRSCGRHDIIAKTFQNIYTNTRTRRTRVIPRAAMRTSRYLCNLAASTVYSQQKLRRTGQGHANVLGVLFCDIGRADVRRHSAVRNKTMAKRLAAAKQRQLLSGGQVLASECRMTLKEYHSAMASVGWRSKEVWGKAAFRQSCFQSLKATPPPPPPTSLFKVADSPPDPRIHPSCLQIEFLQRDTGCDPIPDFTADAGYRCSG